MRIALGRWWAHRRSRRYGATMITATGLKFYPLDARPLDIFTADVARGLANECRYAGQLSVELPWDGAFYSVAEHSVIVSREVERAALDVHGVSEHTARQWAREGLMHDASEAYLGDVIRPLKYLPVMRSFLRVEERLQRVIYERYSVHPTAASHAAVKRIDDAILTDETCLRCGVDVLDYALRHGSLGARIEALPPPEAEAAFLRRFKELWPEEFTFAAR